MVAISVPEDFIGVLSMHRDCTESLLFRAAKLCNRDLEFSTDPELIRIRRMVYDVSGEIHAMHGMVRLRELGCIALYGYMKPRHDIGPNVCGFLARRFPKTIIVLGNSSKSWIALYLGKNVLHSTGKALMETVEALKKMTNCPEDGGTEKLWKTYFWSQYTDERRNLKRFYQCMPRRYLAAAGLRVEGNTNRTSIDDFS